MQRRLLRLQRLPLMMLRAPNTRQTPPLMGPREPMTQPMLLVTRLMGPGVLMALRMGPRLMSVIARR